LDQPIFIVLRQILKLLQLVQQLQKLLITLELYHICVFCELEEKEFSYVGRFQRDL